MISLSVGYPQILSSGYPDSKFTIRFSPTIQYMYYAFNNICLHLLRYTVYSCSDMACELIYCIIYVYTGVTLMHSLLNRVDVDYMN